MHNITNIYHLFYYFILYAFLGWLSEVAFAFFKNRKFVNRGFLYGSFCPIYGIGVVAIFLIVEWTTHAFSSTDPMPILIIFLVTTIATTLIEGTTGGILYKIFGTRWWDYSKRPLNYKGYVCLEFSAIWGVLGSLLLIFFHTKIIAFIDIIPKNIGEPIAFIFAAYFLIDGTLTVRSLVDFKKLLVELESIQQEYIKSKETLVNSMKHAKSELSSRVKNILELEDVKSSLKQLQIHMKTLQSHQSIHGDGLSTTLNDLIDKDKTISSRVKFELKEIYDRYEKRLNKLSSSRLLRVFPSLKSNFYQKYIKDIKGKAKSK